MKYSSGLAALCVCAAFFWGCPMNGFAGQESRVRIFNAATGIVETVDRIVKTDEEWKRSLTPEQYRITRLRGTEPPVSGMCSLSAASGIYQCVCCGTDLFGVDAKFESQTGWPSFYEPVSALNIRKRQDRSHGMTRTEVCCARCDAHLGHVFDDGPEPTGQRYCINSAALKFVSRQEAPRTKAAAGEKTEKATFAAGCFWGVEEAFRKVPGVISTRVGYTGGITPGPSYREVCSGKTGHAEAVEVTFDPARIAYGRLLDVFWKIHDPTQGDRQGPDIGTQYRSVIFYHSAGQEAAARQSLESLREKGGFRNEITTKIVPAGVFYEAEEYHQQYIKKGAR